MTDNVIHGTFPVSAGSTSGQSGGGVGGGGGGPHDSGMSERIKGLEEQSRDTREALIRIEVTLASLATKADVAGLSGKVEGSDKRLGNVEAAVADTLKTAAGKAIGPVQLPAIIVATAGALGAMAWLWRYLGVHGYLP